MGGQTDFVLIYRDGSSFFSVWDGPLINKNLSCMPYEPRLEKSLLLSLPTSDDKDYLVCLLSMTGAISVLSIAAEALCKQRDPLQTEDMQDYQSCCWPHVLKRFLAKRLIGG